MAFDREELTILCRALDKMMTSERKEVKDAFRELSIMVTLIDNSEVPGPLVETLRRLDDLTHRCNSLEKTVYELEKRRYYSSEHQRELDMIRGMRHSNTTRHFFNDPFYETDADCKSKDTPTEKEFKRTFMGIFNSKDK